MECLFPLGTNSLIDGNLSKQKICGVEEGVCFSNSSCCVPVIQIHTPSLVISFTNGCTGFVICFKEANSFYFKKLDAHKSHMQYVSWCIGEGISGGSTSNIILVQSILLFGGIRCSLEMMSNVWVCELIPWNPSAWTMPIVWPLQCEHGRLNLCSCLKQHFTMKRSYNRNI